MSNISTVRGKSPSGTSGLFDIGRQSRSPSPVVRPMFNLKKPDVITPKSAMVASSLDNRILTTTSQPKSGVIPRPAASRMQAVANISEPDSDLGDAVGGAIEAHNPRMTDAEIKDLLVGYVSLPKKYWRTGLVYRQHIRYIRLKDNIFVRGGFIAGIGKQRGKDTLSLTNCFNSRKPGYYAWVVNIDSLKAIFIRRQDWDALRESLGTM
jgi:hypothetical protein